MLADEGRVLIMAIVDGQLYKSAGLDWTPLSSWSSCRASSSHRLSTARFSQLDRNVSGPIARETNTMFSKEPTNKGRQPSASNRANGEYASRLECPSRNAHPR